MDKKLTLSLNQREIEKAKRYAKENSTSISRMIEAYFDSLTKGIKDESEITTTPLVDSLCGEVELPGEFDYKKSRAKYLKEKRNEKKY